MARFSVITLLAAVVVAVVHADIMWDTCEGPADHPTIKEGNYFNLCIKDHSFENEVQAWTFTKSKIEGTEFKECVFQNTNEKTSNFTEATWSEVKFTECRFGSFTKNSMVFDKTVFTNVVFDRCVFHNTVNLNFSKFSFNNVTFNECQFQGDTHFELGQMNEVRFDNCQFQRSESATTPSGTDALRFRMVTMRDVNLKDSNAVNPVRFEGVAGADISFNDSTINQYWCHSPPNGDGDIQYYSGFNDTAFQDVTFLDNMYCDQTTWRGFFMANISFTRNAYFSDSDILDLYWDEVHMESETRETLELDFENTYIKRRVLANTTIVGKANFRNSRFETVFVKNFNAAQPDFTDAQFINQEFIDGHCCSRVCRHLECMCNVSEPSGVCPEGDRSVNVSATWTCFPADATVQNHDGLIVRMEDLAVAEKIAIGNGEHSDVFFFGHRNADEVSEFVSIKHIGSDKPVRLSPGHYLYVDGQLRTARSVRPGQHLRSADGEDSMVVTEVKREELRGLYAPHSMHGDLLVDGVVVSSYTDVMHPGLAHKLLHPLRLLYRYGLDSVVSRMTFLHERSYGHIPSALGIPRGPEAVDN